MSYQKQQKILFHFVKLWVLTVYVRGMYVLWLQSITA